ncbi:type III secretion protein [Pseudomonas sp. N3-W]|uniref:type III secretion protein n=1 Tax=Pseudomonas sp. N3-W TaxID=2975049 RepID=UPI00217CD3FF|nr:type III secretion protein [Pseudomonas sp. N3-W]UWF47434.1 type III secretion protein [Pseudomonas sp. N3-W]
MPHADTDLQAPANDSQLTGLAPTLDLLAPIRRHRLTMAEQAWQRQRHVLNALHTRLAQMTHDLQQLRDNQRQHRQEQDERHANRRLPLNEMNQWLAGEQQALRQIERFEQQFKALQEAYRQQQQWTDDSQQQLRRRQRDMEKLDYLRDLSQEAS